MNLSEALALIMDHMRSEFPVWPTKNEFAAYVIDRDADDVNLPLQVRNALELAKSNTLATLDEIYAD